MASSTSSCSPPQARRHDLRSKRAKLTPEDPIDGSSVGQSSKRPTRDQVVDSPPEEKRGSLEDYLRDIVGAGENNPIDLDADTSDEEAAVRTIDSYMRELNELAKQKLNLMATIANWRKDARVALTKKVEQVSEIAKQMGITAKEPTLFAGVCNIIKNENLMHFFICSGEKERMFIIKQAAKDDVQSTARNSWEDLWDDGWDELMMIEFMDDDDDAFVYGMYQYALHIDKHLTRAEYRQPAMTGLDWVQTKLGDSKSCYNMFRMSPTMFHRLHEVLVQSYGLKSSSKATSVEALGMFLWMVGAPQSVRQAEDRFERSMGTMSNLFNKVLKCMVKLAADIIKPVDPDFTTIHPRLRNPRFYPYFKDCIGAIDGTHVPCVVPSDKFVQHLCRKGMTTQNVMAICDFDMSFTFVIAGWPGSVHDMRVFNDATTTYSHVFPHPPTGKYYLVDSGYANRLGYLAPFKGTNYHLQEYRDAADPQGEEEIFNYAHSSLRNVIERSFGVLKMKWRMLQSIPPYGPHKQSQIIVACCALHNFIRKSGIEDRHFDRCDRDENYVPRQARENQPDPDVVADESDLMNEFRNSIALALANHS